MVVDGICTNVDFNFQTLLWSDQLLIEQQDFIQKWISRFESFRDVWEGNYPYQPHIPVIATVKYQNTAENKILYPDKLRQPDTIGFESITDDHHSYFICHNSSIFEYRTFQGNCYKAKCYKFF